MSAPPASKPPLSLAILDDYASIAEPYFAHLRPSVTTASCPTTLNPAKPDDLSALIQQLQPCTIISTMRERTAFPATLLKELPNLRLLLTTGTRNAALDLAAARAHGVVVAGTVGDAPRDPTAGPFAADAPPPAAYQSTNQHAWALLLALAGRIARDDRAVKSRPTAWQSGLAVPLGGKTLGLVGFGRLGALMARTAVLGFGMRVLAWSANLTQAKADEVAVGAGLERGSVRVVGKREVFADADVVSVHYVLSDRSRGVIGESELAAMKPSALLVNTSRGPLIDEQALLAVLRKGAIRGAALDVFWEEPLAEDSAWRKEENFKSEVVLSPHMGYVNAGTMHRWYEEQAENVERWLKGDEVLHRMD